MSLNLQAQATALSGAASSLANSAFPLTAAAARQRLEPFLDPTLRLISQLDTSSLASLQPALGQSIPALGRHSQLTSPLETIRPLAAGILGDHHYLSVVSFLSLCLIDSVKWLVSFSKFPGSCHSCLKPLDSLKPMGSSVPDRSKCITVGFSETLFPF